MLIDDDAGIRGALELWLQADHQVVSFSSALEALAALRAGPLPDLIVLDLMMPEMNGWEFRVAQKAVSAWAAIPVIVLSANEAPEAAAIDADAHLMKPVDGELFLRTCKEVLSGAAQRRNELLRAGELQRLVSLGALVGGIAHEINNPLAFVYGSIDVLKRLMSDYIRPGQIVEREAVAAAMRALGHASEGADRISAVVRSASLFAASDLQGTELLDVHDVIESAIQVASNEIRHGARLMRIYHDLPHVHGNPARLGQVFLNLLLNALSAIRASGERDHVICVETSFENGKVIASIADSASTLVATSLDIALDPARAFFGSGRRVQFGLSVSREFIEDMGGTLEASAEQPRGARYRVILPAVGRSSVPAPPIEPSMRLGAARGSVLVVDDEPLLCEMLSTMLAEDFEVTAFSSPRAALDALRERDFDAILCDVMMPDLNGIELFESAVRERPELARRFVFITGGAFTEGARLFLKQTGRPVLSKPCDRRELLRAVEQVSAQVV